MKLYRFVFLIIFTLFFVFQPVSLLAITVEISATVIGCGDDIVQNSEQCDGSDLAGATCVSRGFISGSLSCNPSCTFNTSSCDSASSGGGAGGGGGGGGGPAPAPSIPATNVIFSGRAYPKSTITLLKDAQIAASTIAGADSTFQLGVSNLAGGNYIFSVYSEDTKGVRSNLLTFPISVTSSATTSVGGIFIAPTIAVDKSEVRRGDNIAIFGQSSPNSEITISVNSEEEFFVKTSSDKDGVYLQNFDTSVLEMGQHFTKSKASVSGEISSFSKALGFIVGTKNVEASVSSAGESKGDLNSDKKINLIDFSIAAFWYGKASPPANVDFNADGKVNLIDFSIMAFYWTG